MGPRAGTRDRWAEWLAERRFGGDRELRDQVMAQLEARRDRVLELAQLSPGETLLDVGCGEGLIGFGALASGAGAVVFSDVSEDVLAVCRAIATELGVLDRCRFVMASADDLAGMADETVDVVTTRSVLIYVADKPAAFREFARVLRPGGRISLFEPINRFAASGGAGWAGYDFRPLADIGQKVRAVYTALQPATDPMLDFDERDLLELAERAGFFPVRLLLEAEIAPTEPRSWDSFVNTAGNPNIPTLAEAMQQALSASEQEELTSYLRPLVEQGLGRWRMALAHLYATKPASTGNSS